MPIGVKIAVPDLEEAFHGLEGQHAAALTEAMRGATDTLKTGLRAQVRAAGFSARLANTWRANSYPKSGNSLDPAGYAWSNAPDIIDAFSKETVIRPHGGKNYLWLPTKNVPLVGGRRRMTPDEVDTAFDQDLIIRNWRGGRRLAFVSVIRAKNKRGGFRRATRGRVAQGRGAELVLMFVLVPQIVTRKRFDLQDEANQAATDFIQRYEQAVR
jgi:hypothetical protein